MRHRGHVLDRADVQADGLQRADGGFATGTGAFDAHFNFLHAMRHCLARGILGDLLRGVSGALARAFEPDPPGSGPANQISVHIRDANLCVIERGQNVGNAGADVFGVLGLDDFFCTGVLTQKFGGGRRRSDNEGGGALMIVGIIFIILSPIVAQLIQLAISRRREYLADASGSLLTRYPEGLARALEKISVDTAVEPTASSATAHLYIANPFKNSGRFLANAFSTHPPIEERIKRLREMTN